MFGQSFLFKKLVESVAKGIGFSKKEARAIALGAMTGMAVMTFDVTSIKAWIIENASDKDNYS